MECCWLKGAWPFEGLLEDAGGRGGAPPTEGFLLPLGGPGLALGGVSEGVEFRLDDEKLLLIAVLEVDRLK